MNPTKSSIIMALSSLLLACERPAEPPLPPRPALVTIVGSSAANSSMVLVGEVKSRYETNLGFRINGKIIERNVEAVSYTHLFCAHLI